MKYLINSVACGTSKQDVFDAKSIISALMRNGGVLNTRVFGIDMSSCMDDDELSDDNKDINGMKNYRARTYLYDISGNFVQMHAQQIAGRGETIIILRSVLAGENSSVTSSSGSSTKLKIKVKGKKSTVRKNTTCDDNVDNVDIIRPSESDDTTDTLRKSSKTADVIEKKVFCYGDSTCATLWESSERVKTTNSRRRTSIKLAISSDDKNMKSKRVRHKRSVQKHAAATLEASIKADRANTIKAQLDYCQLYSCKKPNCSRAFLKLFDLKRHTAFGVCYNGTATQSITTRKRKFDSIGTEKYWVAKPALMPIQDYCIQLAQNDQLTTARLDPRMLTIPAIQPVLSSSTSFETMPLHLKPERTRKILINQTALLQKQTEHIFSESEDSFAVPSPNRLGALKAKSTKTPRTSSQLLCVLQAFLKGVVNKKDKLTSTQFAYQMSIMGTFPGEIEFPNNVWMKRNPHGFPTFAKIELLDRHQVKSYFGSGLSKLQSTYQNLLDKELSLFECSFVINVRAEVKRRKEIGSDKMVLTVESLREKFASYFVQMLEHAPYVVTVGKNKFILSTIMKTSKDDEEKMLKLQYQLRTKKAREEIIHIHVTKSPLTYIFIRPLV